MWPVRRFDLQWWIFLSQVKIQHTQASSKIPITYHLSTSFAYKLKLHHKRNQYLRARLNTCANVNIMPINVYKLLFQDPDLKKLSPSKLDIGTYTTDAVKLVGSCVFYFIHQDTKHLQAVTFYVANSNCSMLLSCMTMLALGLIQPHTRLDYLPTRASLISSSAAHPKKTKSQVKLHVTRKTIWSVYSVQPKRYGTQAYYKQGTDSYSLFRCVWRYRMLFWSPITYSSRS